MANTDPQGQLQAAAKAWGDLQHAESQVARLRGYSALTPGMKDDQRKALRTVEESRAVLNTVLRMPALSAAQMAEGDATEDRR